LWWLVALEVVVQMLVEREVVVVRAVIVQAQPNP
jgi:hypothetical protein